ncbi:MAG: GTP-binding protein [Gammaproteobacteria bacterium]|nr:GTP-binding protein [Gammaproteobacteria bacterium]
MSSNIDSTSLIINAAPSESTPLAPARTSPIDVNLPSSPSPGDSIIPSTTSTVFSSSAPNQTALFFRKLNSKITPAQPSSFSSFSTASSPKTESSFLPFFSRTHSNSASNQPSPFAPSPYWGEQSHPKPECNVHSILTDLSLSSHVDREGMRDPNKIISEHNFSINLRSPLNIIFLGNSTVGKSSLLNRIVDASYINKDNNLLLYGEKEISVCGQNIKLKMWDPKSSSLRLSLQNAPLNLFHQTHIVALLCFDVTNKNSFDSIDRWKKEVICLFPNSEPKILLVATKCDPGMAREVTYAQAKEYADEAGLFYFETSAERGSNDEHLTAALALAPFDKEDIKDLSIILPHPGRG